MGRGVGVQHFRISSSLKDIIGRDLITNDFVAVFELVKNSFDAHARRVDIVFDAGRLWIVDNGKGMSQNDILSKWLFVAFSAKRTGEEDDDLPEGFRDKISQRRGYAGNKGIGRFSCDRLGRALELFSQQIDSKVLSKLEIDWTDFELDPKQEFADINVKMTSPRKLPEVPYVPALTSGGTILAIGELREQWSRQKLLQLRDYLAKLVDPFAPPEDMEIHLHAPAEEAADEVDRKKGLPTVNGTISNTIMEVLEGKTTRLSVELTGGKIVSTLRDRDRLIYEIEEDNPYKLLNDATVSADLFFLNRSAKATFTRRMGVEPVKFGSVFLFLNGFRVFPIGEEGNDEFGIDRRKQQGYARYLGTRDVLGRIDVVAPVAIFREASSRDTGLVEGPRTKELDEFVLRHLLTRLEKYVVDVTWADTLDADRSDTSGLSSEQARSRIIEVVRLLVGRKGVRLLNYDRELIDTISDRATEFERAMDGLAVVAEQTGDRALLDRIEKSRRRFEQLREAAAEAERKAEEESRRRAVAEAAARAADQRAHVFERKYEQERSRSLLLTSLEARDSETLTLLHHQVIIYATAIQDAVANNLRALAEGDQIDPDDLAADLEQISFQNSRILAVTRFATQANFKMDADWIEADLIQFMDEYVSNVASLYEGGQFATFDPGGNKLVTRFKPIDVSIVLDNLMSNARKAQATRIAFTTRRIKQSLGLEILVEDDGRGVDPAKADRSRIFEKGYSGTTSGSGLGLYHAMQVITAMGGSIGLDPEYEAGGARFLIRLPRPPKGKGAENEA
jgi:signal transduction histidine kinase